MSTIQQQLEAIGNQLTVDGIEFNAEYYEADHDGYSFLIGRKKVQIFWMLEKGTETHFNKWIMKYGAVFGGTPMDVTFTAPTIEEACLEALRLCREKVAEIGKALGMNQKPNYAELLEEYKEHSRTLVYATASIPIVSNGEGGYCFNGELKDYIEVLGGNCDHEYVANELLQGDFPYQLANKEGVWYYEFLLKYHAGDDEEPSWLELLHTNAEYLGTVEEGRKSSQEPCIDPFFEITGCFMPKGSCAACGGGSPLLNQPTGEKEDKNEL